MVREWDLWDLLLVHEFKIICFDFTLWIGCKLDKTSINFCDYILWVGYKLDRNFYEVGSPKFYGELSNTI